MMVDTTPQPVKILARLGVRDARSVTRVHGGADTVVWRVDHGGNTYALRLFREGEQERCRREITAMESARRGGVPAPVVHSTGSWRDRPVLLLSWCPGVPLWEILQRKPWRVWILGRALGRMQALIHQITAPPNWQAEGSEWIKWAGHNELAVQRRLRDQPLLQSRLLHLDYHSLNVLTDGTRITGVIDWANARGGDPRADVARTYTILAVEPLTPGRPPHHLRTLRWLLARRWRAGYQQAAGWGEQMMLFYAWAGAVMQRDLAPRVAHPDSWWEPRHLEQIRRWTEKCKWQAQLPT